MTATPLVIGVETDAPEAVRVSIRHGGVTRRMRVAASVPLFTARADALVPLGLLVAMAARAPLVVEGVVSPRLLGRLDRIQDIVRAFSGGTLERVTVDASPAAEVGAGGRGTGAFFSGGVDSLYTAFKHRPELSHLVFMQGFGPYEIGTPRGLARRAHARAVADEWGKELVEVELDVHDATKHAAPWLLAHGLVLSAVALTLQSSLRQMYVPASQSYRDLFPLLTHPLLDPLWSTETLEIVHDGCEATRVDKVRALSRDEIALEHLAVCNKPHAVVNCGGCEKCLRTMTSLYFAGALGRCPTLPDKLPVGAIARVDALGARGRSNWREPAAMAARRREWRLYLAIRWVTRPRPLLPVRAALRRRMGALRR